MPVDIKRVNNDKEKIVSFIKTNGPSLPVQVARATGISPLFASAFLSELYGERELFMSHMKVGSSPLYLIPGQEPLLENFTQYLNSREKEALSRLKKSKFLDDERQEPVIRVALRAIPDFAIPLRIRVNEEMKLFWKHFLVTDEEIKNILENKPENKSKEQKEIKKEIEPILEEKEVVKEIEKEEKTNENIDKIKEIERELLEKRAELEKVKNSLVKEKKKQKIKPKQVKSNYFETVKNSLEQKQFQIIEIIEKNNKECILKVSKDNKQSIIIAFNKKNIDEKELIKMKKKINPYNSEYTIYLKDSPSKKLKDTFEAYKQLSSIEKL